MSFHPFGELPIDLQEHIRRYAATPLDVLELNDKLFSCPALTKPQVVNISLLFFRDSAPCPAPRYMSRLYDCDWSHKHDNDYNANEIYIARAALRQVCRLSREITLKAWRCDVNVMTIRHGWDAVFLWERGDFVMKWKEEVKAEIIELLTKLIK